MPRYRFTYPYAWVQPGDGTRPNLTAEPGDELDADENPDPHFWEEIGGEETPAVSPETAAEPEE